MVWKVDFTSFAPLIHLFFLHQINEWMSIVFWILCYRIQQACLHRCLCILDLAVDSGDDERMLIDNDSMMKMSHSGEVVSCHGAALSFSVIVNIFPNLPLNSDHSLLLCVLCLWPNYPLSPPKPCYLMCLNSLRIPCLVPECHMLSCLVPSHSPQRVSVFAIVLFSKSFFSHLCVSDFLFIVFVVGSSLVSCFCLI